MQPIDPHELLRLAIPNLKDYAVIVLDTEGAIIGWLAGAEQVLGYTADDVLGKPLSTLFVAEDADKGVPQYELEVARRRSSAQDDRWQLRKDGSRVWVTGTLTAITDDSGLRGFLKIMRDRTDLRMQMESRANALAAAEDALEFTRSFLRTLGHELRNPLGAIKNIAYILGRSPEAQLKGFSGIVSNQIAVLERLASDLMDVSRLEQHKVELRLESLDMVELVRDEVQARRYEAAAQGVQIDAIVAPNPVMVRGDRDRLRQALGNLIANALKYTPRGGHVWVKAVEEVDDAVVRVQDTGIGIAPDVLPRIFELFTQEQRAREVAPGGLGIGLAIVREIVNMHGGMVQARSGGVGKGAEFAMRLPRDGAATR
jgi:PAS domain S-box-containing protein